MLRDVANTVFASYPLAICAALGLLAGYLVRLAVNARQKRKLLTLEDKMLYRHAKILTLESKKAALEKKNAELKESSYSNAKLKAS